MTLSAAGNGVADELLSYTVYWQSADIIQRLTKCNRVLTRVELITSIP
jgi:hypothetical protein